MLCCAVLCYAVLCCAVLCCAALRCAALRCAVLCCAVPCYAMLCHAMLEERRRVPRHEDRNDEPCQRLQLHRDGHGAELLKDRLREERDLPGGERVPREDAAPWEVVAGMPIIGRFGVGARPSRWRRKAPAPAREGGGGVRVRLCRGA
jgi:hypothetical protein